MAKGPALYPEIGKQVRDLLYKGYQTDHRFTVTSCSATGVTISTSGTQKDDFLLADISTLLKNKNVTTEVKVDTNSNLFTTITVDEPAPRLKTILSFRVPDQRSGKVEVQYLHDYTAISSSIGLKESPIVNFSGVVGTNAISFGTDLSFDTKTWDLIKCNAGFSFLNTDIVASLSLNDKGDSLTVSYYHSVSPMTAVGAEVNHVFSSSNNTITVGIEHVLDALSVVKARLNNVGKMSALLQHEWRPKSFFTFSCEVDAKAIEKSTRVGLALALKL